MSYERMILEKKEGIARTILNRPEKLNAMDRKLRTELFQALQEVEKDGQLGVVIIRGNGRAFCAGRDLSELGSETTVSLEEEQRAANFLDICSLIENMSKPVIAAVHGFAITGGFLLAYSCDLIVAAENTRFIDTHAIWGLIPGGGESQKLPRRIGMFKAKELFFTGDALDAVEAQRLGLVSKVVPYEKLDETAEEMAKKILRNSSRAIGTLKMLVNRGMKLDFESAMKLEGETCRGFLANIEPEEDRDSRLRKFHQKKMSAG